MNRYEGLSQNYMDSFLNEQNGRGRCSQYPCSSRKVIREVSQTVQNTEKFRYIRVSALFCFVRRFQKTFVYEIRSTNFMILMPLSVYGSYFLVRTGSETSVIVDKRY